MNIIEVTNLVKEYKKIKKESGLRGAVKNLFVQKSETVRAVDDISFSIEKLFTFLLPLAWMTFWPVKDMLGLGGLCYPCASGGHHPGCGAGHVCRELRRFSGWNGEV